nr:hybrid signal transduction histidine kinase M [Tanacetum cinerariifolium]
MVAGDAPPQPPPNTDKIIYFSIPNKVSIKLDLEKHNYNSWSSFSLIHLGSLGLKSHVEDETASTNPDWCQLDDLIKMWILSSFCDSLQEQVVTTPGNAKALWDHLKDLFHDNKDNRAINLDNELRSIKIGTMTVNEYCTKIRSMVDRLKNLGCDGVSLEVEGEDWGFDSNEEEVVPKVDDVSLVDGVFDGAFGGDGEKDVVMGEGVVVASSSLERLTKSCLGGMMVSLIFLEGLEEEA